MHENVLMSLFGQILLPLFVVALLFSFAGVNPDLVIRSAASIVTSLLEGMFKLIQSLGKLILSFLSKHPR